MIRKTTQAFQVNQARPKNLPGWIPDGAWAHVEAMPTSACGTLIIETGEDIQIHLAGDRDGKPARADSVCFTEAGIAGDPAMHGRAVENYLSVTASQFGVIVPDGLRGPMSADTPIHDMTGGAAPTPWAAQVAAATQESIAEAERSVKVVPTPRKKRGT